jgi:hypothetical protein
MKLHAKWYGKDMLRQGQITTENSVLADEKSKNYTCRSEKL